LIRLLSLIFVNTVDLVNLNVHGIIAVFDVRNRKGPDATAWATNLNSYTVKVDETNRDILVNPNEFLG
jgi:hypothetical protein